MFSATQTGIIKKFYNLAPNKHGGNVLCSKVW